MHTLKLYDQPLLDFDMKRYGDSFKVSTCRLYENALPYLPLDWNLAKINDPKKVEQSDQLAVLLKQWLKHRAIPSNRAYVKSFLAKLGLSNQDIPGIIDICLGLSLNDCYWIVPKNDSSTFTQRNLYDNRFNRTLSRLAFTGVGSKVNSEFASTPELTTNGMLAKCWRRIEGKVYLYKEGSIGFANSGNEPYAEYYAAQVAEAMGVKHVDYVPTKWDGHFCSRCELFTSKEFGFISAGRLVHKGGIDAVEKYCSDLGPEFNEAFADMLAFDAIVLNIDRHFGNFGFIVDNLKNKIIAPAPLFDHGMALLYSAMKDDFDDIEAYEQLQLPRTYDNFIARARQSMGTTQRKKVRALFDFRFRKHPRYNWPQWRLEKLEDMIHRRAKMLLE